MFPFAKFPGADTILGPEMRSTGEVMGIAATFALRLRQGDRRQRHRARGSRRPQSARAPAFISVKDEDKPAATHIAQRLRALGFDILATRGTAAALARARVP